MASYFDLPPQQSKSAATAEVVGLPKDEEAFGRMSLLSPQVTRILDDLDLEEHSSSDDDDSLSGNSESSEQEGASKEKDTQSSKEPGKHTHLAPPRPELGTGRQKQPHFARFHSLRSMLFSSRIEADIQKSNEAREQEEAEAKWKAEYESRKGLNRPKTPERPSSSGSNSPTKEGFRHRIGNRIRRMTSKEVPTMSKLPEDSVPEINDNESTASSDNDGEGDAEREKPWRPRDPDEESINHSDVEDLVRWVSRRDPPSDGEARKGKSKAQDDDHESVGDSDVDDLVRWVSRRPGKDQKPDIEITKPEAEERVVADRMGYSDASTESDSEVAAGRGSSSGDEDAEELSRWISHKDGPNAGPVRQNQQKTRMQEVTSNNSDSESSSSNPPELAGWISRHDDTSGESEVPGSGRSTPFRRDGDSQAATRPENRSTLTHNDIDELVRWVSRKDSKAEPSPQEDKVSELKAEEDSKKEKIGMTGDTGRLGHNDISELVNFVKQKDDQPHPAPGEIGSVQHKFGETQDFNAKDIQATEEEKKEKLGMRSDMGSLSHRDVNELVDFVKSKDPSQDTEKQAFLEQEQEKKEQLGMKRDVGSLSHRDVNELVDFVKSKDQSDGPSNTDTQTLDIESKQQEKKEQLGMRGDRGSLSHGDVNELVEWVSNKK